MKLFGLCASEEGARRVATELGVELAAHEEREFEDGEFKIRPLESVRDEHVFVYQSLAASTGASPNDKLMRLLCFAGALKDAYAAAVSVVTPYLAFARKDCRTKPRDPVTTRYVAQLLEAAGVDEIIAADVHNAAAFENAFRCRTRRVDTAPLFVEHFSTLAGSSERVVVVSPDAGGMKRARAFSVLLAQRVGRRVDMAFVEKYRSEGHVSGELFAGDVEGASVIVFDDLISGGTTISRAASLCIERGAECVHAAAAHAVLAPEAAAKLLDSGLESLVVSDTVADVHERARALESKLVVLDSAGLMAGAIRERLPAARSGLKGIAYV